MNNQKNRFWTFVLSLVPGAGEMYFGLYRQGVSLMLCFWALFILPMLLQISALSLLALVLWFYSFLHTHNLRSMPLEEFCQLEDCYIWENLSMNFRWNQKYQRIAAVVLIVLGCFLLWENLFSWLGWYLSGPLSNLVYWLPRIALGVLVLLLGVWLITGKKREMNQEEDEPNYRDAGPRQTPPYSGGPRDPWGNQPPAAPVFRAAPEQGSSNAAPNGPAANPAAPQGAQPQNGGDPWQVSGQTPQAPAQNGPAASGETAGESGQGGQEGDGHADA